MAKKAPWLEQYHFNKDNAAEMGRRGQVKSIEARKNNKKLKETFDLLLSMKLKKGRYCNPEQVKSFAELNGKNIDIQTAIGISMVKNAINGDVRAAEYIRDTMGQKPKEEIQADFDGVEIICDIPKE